MWCSFNIEHHTQKYWGGNNILENSYYKNLMMTVIRSSESDNWKDAVVEWDIDDCEEDLSCSSEREY